MRTIFAFLLLCGLSQAADFIPDSDPPFLANDRADSIGDRVVQLPEDGHAWRLDIFISDEQTPRERAIVSWFATDPELHKLSKQTHFRIITPRSAIWKTAGKGINQSIPCVWLGNAENKRIAKYSGNSSQLDSAKNLKRALAADMSARESNSDCRPRPEPAPPYNPDTRPLPPIPDTPGPHEPDVEPLHPVETVEHWGMAAGIVGLIVLLALATPLLFGLAYGVSYFVQRNKQGI